MWLVLPAGPLGGFDPRRQLGVLDRGVLHDATWPFGRRLARWDGKLDRELHWRVKKTGRVWNGGAPERQGVGCSANCLWLSPDTAKGARLKSSLLSRRIDSA